MKTHFVWFIYLLTVVCCGGWYIYEQKQIIAELEYKNQELIVSQRPPVEPKERKVKVIEQEIDKTVVCKEVIDQFNVLKDQCYQCAYQLKFYQESEKIKKGLQKESTDGKGEKDS